MNLHNGCDAVSLWRKKSTKCSEEAVRTRHTHPAGHSSALIESAVVISSFIYRYLSKDFSSSRPPYSLTRPDSQPQIDFTPARSVLYCTWPTQLEIYSMFWFLRHPWPLFCATIALIFKFFISDDPLLVNTFCARPCSRQEATYWFVVTPPSQFISQSCPRTPWQ